MGRVALGQVYLWVLQFSPDNIIPLMLHVHSFFHLPPMLYSLSIWQSFCIKHIHCRKYKVRANMNYNS
jgi:hypothetical protein